MTIAGWSVVEAVARLLEPEEREAVLGDLTEASEGAWQALVDVLGLVVRKQVTVWSSWRPWLASFGLALPGSLLLMGFSLSVSQAYQRLIAPALLTSTGLRLGPGFTLLLCNIALLIGWSWTGGFVMGSVSRRTVRASAVLSFLPCLFCLERFRVESISRLCLLIFLPPAIWGVRRGLQLAQIKLRSALLLAVGITAMTIPTWDNRGSWIPNWALSWPAWYLVATAARGRMSLGGKHWQTN